jgi:YfiH family protein
MARRFCPWGSSMMPDCGDEFRYEDFADGWQVGRFDSLGRLGCIEHIVTTRRGPSIPSDPQLLGPTAITLRDRLRLEGIAWCRQVHGTDVLRAHDHGALEAGDGLVTDRLGLGLMGRSADCPLILVADREGRGVGMAHASWRGTVGRIARELVRRLEECFHVPPRDCIAAICPSAGPCCYEVGPEVREAAISAIGSHAAGFFHLDSGSLRFDLWKANASELIRSGIPKQDVHIAEVCTICHNDLYPSYRAEGSAAGRFASVIALRQDGGSRRGSG